MSSKLLDTQLTPTVSGGSLGPQDNGAGPLIHFGKKPSSRSVGTDATQGLILCSYHCSVHPKTQSSTLLPSSPLPGALVSDPINHRVFCTLTCRTLGGVGAGWGDLYSLWRSSSGILRYFGGRPILEREGSGPQQGISSCLEKTGGPTPVKPRT